VEVLNLEGHRRFGEGRGLNEHETAELRKVYGDSLDYSRIKVHDNLPDGGFWRNDRATSIGNEIYLPESDKDPSTLVHEAAHQWQYQNGGPAYITRAGAAQGDEHGYDWRQATSQGKSWAQLNPEQQAQLVQDAYRAGYFDNPNNPSISAEDRRIYADAAANLRAGRGAPGM
jgi:hypothetical protein